MNGVKAVKIDKLSSKYSDRFVIIDEDTGEVLDDAQGYGYKTAQKAYSAFAYKNRDKSKDKEKAEKKKQIKKWIKDHKEFSDALEICEWDIIKGCNDKLDAEFVRSVLKQLNLNPEFTAGEILRVWLNS